MKTPEPLSPELEALLAPHRTVLPLAPSVEARAIARAAAAKESPEQGAGRAPGRPLWVFAAAAGAVLALGAVAYAARAWRSAPDSPAAMPVAPAASSRVTAARRPSIAMVVPETTESATITAPEAAPRRRIVRKTGAPTLAATNAELQLLRAARQDVTGGDFADALAAIAEHVRRFRHGSLVEEREALRVKALAGLGRHEDAQRAAAEFHARFPHSVFLSTFERMKETDR
jgi:hypothetical protein